MRFVHSCRVRMGVTRFASHLRVGRGRDCDIHRRDQRLRHHIPSFSDCRVGTSARRQCCITFCPAVLFGAFRISVGRCRRCGAHNPQGEQLLQLVSCASSLPFGRSECLFFDRGDMFFSSSTLATCFPATFPVLRSSLLRNSARRRKEGVL